VLLFQTNGNWKLTCKKRAQRAATTQRNFMVLSGMRENSEDTVLLAADGFYTEKTH